MMDARAGTLRALLDRARWAPSADNTQPWHFHILRDDACRIDYLPHSGMGVFNLDHYTGHLAMGGLLETLRLAAGAAGWEIAANAEAFAGTGDALALDVRLLPGAAEASPLASVIEQRTTQRRLMQTRAVTDAVRQSIEADLPPGYRVLWIGHAAGRQKIAQLMSCVGKVRLLIPETYAVHRDTVAWGARYSIDRIPSEAIGADPLTRHIMAWALRAHWRVIWLNRVFGHVLPRLEMDYWPARACGAHFFLLADATDDTRHARLRHGAAMQRFWLSATRHGLQFQPEMAPLVFARYLRAGTAFTTNRAMVDLMRDTAERFAALLGRPHWENTVFMGRVGYGRAVQARSLRKPLETLLDG